ncbi:hypothetical protein LUZ60_015419 [Juncus effusus]|nr:hypothetical protein LUZ60_015419 [Juncus effusus]
MNGVSTKMIAIVPALVLCSFLLLSMSKNVSAGKSDNGANFNVSQWCIADEQTPDDVLQKALDWACGPGGADCAAIQSRGPCYLPNTKKDHASYAFNSYWHKYKTHGATCNFKSAAIITDLDPSHGRCHFEPVP